MSDPAIVLVCQGVSVPSSLLRTADLVIKDGVVIKDRHGHCGRVATDREIAKATVIEVSR